MGQNRNGLLYPFVVGLLLGLLQTGLFFQLSLTMSSGFTTYLLITLCWLMGGAVGALYASRNTIQLRPVLVIALVCYGVCSLLVNVFPFNTQLWLLYAVLIGAAGVYPGVFFVNTSPFYTARRLFLWENNGFICGMILTTLLFMFVGRMLLWIAPAVLTIMVYLWTRAAIPRLQAELS